MRQGGGVLEGTFQVVEGSHLAKATDANHPPKAIFLRLSDAAFQQLQSLHRPTSNKGSSGTSISNSSSSNALRIEFGDPDASKSNSNSTNKIKPSTTKRKHVPTVSVVPYIPSPYSPSCIIPHTIDLQAPASGQRRLLTLD